MISYFPNLKGWVKLTYPLLGGKRLKTCIQSGGIIRVASDLISSHRLP